MSHREVRRPSFADVLVRQRPGVNADLGRVVEVVKWYRFEKLLSGVYASAEGRPSYPPLVLLKCLLLQQWYALSDAGLEEAVSDRLSFRKFVGLSLEDDVPDHTTICRFRNKLVELKLMERVFAEVERQLDKQGLILKTGTLIDASLVAADADVRRDPDGEKLTSDEEAGFAQSRGRTFYGYKAHVAVDRGSGLVRRALLTSADVHDSKPADQLICGDEAKVFADKAYDSKARRQLLKEMGIRNGIMRRGARAHPLSKAQTDRNRALSPIRSAVERVFGTWKRTYRYTRVRYRGLAKNATQLLLLCCAFNLRRAMVLAT